MPQISVSPEQEAEIYATVMREKPKIERAVIRMFKQLKSLEGVSQKDKEMALLLSEHMREQVDVHIRESHGRPAASLNVRTIHQIPVLAGNSWALSADLH